MMTEPPGSISRSITPHPRRPPAHKSVSLRHSPPAGQPSHGSYHPQSSSVSSPNAPASDRANPPSTLSAKTTVNKQSSGESSDAGKWFENTNNNALQSNASFVENGSPFLIRNSSSSGTPPDGHDSNSAYIRAQSSSMPYRPGMRRLNTDGSSAEEFRSVIDDLTVANKKLKQKLRKYEKLYDAHLQDEKLFEVRFHGLPAHKKRELEETLQKFASGLDESPHSENPLISSYAPQLDTHNTASSTSRFAESGYASVSASGRNSTSAPSGHENNGRKMTKSLYNRQQQNIQSYLHDIPAGLLPRHNVLMTESSRKKLVVRRLEQIFAGKQSLPGNHPMPMQQEEVAQSAAMADRRAQEATGQHSKKEGLRVARIMPARFEDEDIARLPPPESIQKLQSGLGVNEHDFVGSVSPDQRPTRPLDLDPHRAQVPAENMDYIRHLGFTPPHMTSEDSPQDGHGWVYLNLLINMAQLHTINVTPDFVKDALAEYSSKFELSHDGRKVRWKGAQDLTLNSDSSSEQFSGYSPYDASAGYTSVSSSKRMKTGHSGESGETMLDLEKHARSAARAMKVKEQNKFAYTPLFFHKQESDDEDNFYNGIGSSSNSPFLAQQRGDSSGFGSSAMRSSTSRKRRDDGPMIFYNKANFCTDLTGDRRGLPIGNPTTYESITSQPLGATSKKSPSNGNFSEPRGSLDTAPMDVDGKDSERIATSSGEEFDFSPPDLRQDSSDGSAPAMDFEASGLGGVQPDDNFSIRVRRSHVRAESSTTARHKGRKLQRYSKKILDALSEQGIPEGEWRVQQQSVMKEEILSASRKDLPSSTLPPASFLPFDSASSGDVDSDLEFDAVSSSPSTMSTSDGGSDTVPQLRNTSPTHPSTNHPTTAYPAKDVAESTSGKESDSEGEESDSEGEESDASIDFLATARKLDPSTIMASEREYDAAIADRLAEEIPAGSSAATAGGGSGFNSPASADGDEKTEDAQKQNQASASSSARTKKLKRARTQDSSATALQPGEGRKLS